MKVHYVKAARKDYPAHDIKKGDSYYWWEFRHGGKRMSKTRPPASQLTQSAYKSQLLAAMEQIEREHAMLNLSDRKKREALDLMDAFRDTVEGIISDLESLRLDQEDSLYNMPEHLQESSASGELLQRRIETCESFAAELQAAIDQYDEDMTIDELEGVATEVIDAVSSVDVE